MNLKETFDWYVKAGYLKAIPRDNLTLYNYTTQTVMKGNWNYHTRCARGLILDEKGNCVARPFQKFFGLFEREETYLQNLPKEYAEIATKYDGSLIIVFQNPNLPDNAWDAATRGSWDNEQIRSTRRWLKTHSEKLEPGYTYCFELIAPWNRVVIPYDKEEMIYLGRVDEHGNESSYTEAREYAIEVGLTPVEFTIGHIEEIEKELVNLPYEFEGFVARFPCGLRVKMKAPHYEERHKEI